MGGGKIVAVGASILLVVGVCVGLIVGVSRKNSNDDGYPKLSTSSKAMAAVCGPTDFKEACFNSVNSAANNKSATPKDFIQAAIQSTIHVVEEAIKKTGTVFDTGDPSQKMAMEDCEELLSFAIDELKASHSAVGGSALESLGDRKDEILNWLSAVISYQQSCIDGVNPPELRHQMSNAILQNATQLTSNALAIVSSISGIINTFHPPMNKTASSRRLLSLSETGDGNFPEWLSASDRKLLESHDNGELTPDAVVDKDGSGQYKTIAEALDAYPKELKGRYVIYVKTGIYEEYLTVTKDQVNVFMYGDGPRKTIITGHKNNGEGVSTFRTATFSAIGTGFIAKSMGFQNTAGPEGHQAVALRVQSDMSAFYHCRMDGYQDTLYAQTHRQFYHNCIISGTVDFIFGDSATVVQNSLIIVRKPMDNQQNTITAHGRSEKRETTGFVIHNCRIVPEQKLFPLRFKIPTYLGRPWKLFSRTVIMEAELGDFIQPAGWLPWDGTYGLDTLYYAEFANRGPGAVTNNRVNWLGYHVITNRNEALQFTAGSFIQGGLWLKDTGTPFLLGLRH
ncbi:pectinesterase-like [Pistacia vera]|uniref:pectinesterase-like n=1 Tax=Pistacia vera TaxID=55513 RepID=UPI0012633378|nr:pectinesterase-like [Pistacia vera]